MKKFGLKWIVAFCLAAFVSVSAFSWEDKYVRIGRFYGSGDHVSYTVFSSPDDLLSYYKTYSSWDDDSQRPANPTLGDIFPGMKADDLPKGKFCIWTDYESENIKKFDRVPASIISLIPDWIDERDNYPIVGLDLGLLDDQVGYNFSLEGSNVVFIERFGVPCKNVTFGSNKLFFINTKIDDEIFRGCAEDYSEQTKKRFRDKGYKGNFE